jgi:hypothetical protein
MIRSLQVCVLISMYFISKLTLKIRTFEDILNENYVFHSYCWRNPIKDETKEFGSALTMSPVQCKPHDNSDVT